MLHRSPATSVLFAALALIGAGCSGRPEVVHREPLSESDLRLFNEAGVARVKWVRQCEYAPITLHPIMIVPRTKKVVPEEIRKEHTFPSISASGAAYLVLEGYLYKIDAANGRVRWRFPVENRDVQVVEADEMVACYVDLGGRGILRGIHALSGTLLWHGLDLPGRASLAAAAGRAYLQSKDTLVAVDIRNGDLLWRKHFPFGPDYDGVVYALAVSNSAVICEWLNKDRGSREVLALDLFTGKQEWQAMGRVVATEGDRVHLYNERTHYLMTRDLKTGELVNDLALDLYDGTFMAVVGDHVLYSSAQTYFRPPGTAVPADQTVGATGGSYTRHEILAVSLQGGKVDWSFEYREPEELVAVEICGDVLFVARKSEIYGYNDIVFHEIAAYEMGSGELLWSALAPSGLVNFSAAEDWVLVRTRDGWCSAIQHRRRKPGETVAPAPNPPPLPPSDGEDASAPADEPVSPKAGDARQCEPANPSDPPPSPAPEPPKEGAGEPAAPPPPDAATPPPPEENKPVPPPKAPRNRGRR